MMFGEESDITEIVSGISMNNQIDYLSTDNNNNLENSIFDVFGDNTINVNQISDIEVDEILGITQTINPVVNSPNLIIGSPNTDTKSVEELIKDLSSLIANTRVAGYNNDVFLMNISMLIPITIFIGFILISLLLFSIITHQKSNTTIILLIVSIIVFALILLICYFVARRIILQKQDTKSKTYENQINQILLEIIKLL